MAQYISPIALDEGVLVWSATMVEDLVKAQVNILLGEFDVVFCSGGDALRFQNDISPDDLAILLCHGR